MNQPLARGAAAVLAAGAILAALTGPASADVRSQALYARGLVPFNQGQWDQAHELFDEAVRADANDALALYYRGLTQARRGQRAAAIADIERALNLNPTLPRAALDLGILYFDTEDYAAAKPWLERAREQGIERFTAALFLGLTHYRLGDYAAAVTYLNEAKTDPELRAAATYYSGLALLQRGDLANGRAELVSVAREQPETEVGRAAQAYLAGVPPEDVPKVKPWSVYGKLSLQYDSNVVIGPSDATFEAAGLGAEGDGLFAIGAGGEYTFLETTWGSMAGRYDFYQSVHFSLTEFDLQGHSFEIDAVSPPGPFTYGVWGGYHLYLLDYQSFFQEGLGVPWLAIAEGENTATQIYYRLRGRDFFRGPFDPGRDAINNAFGIGQLLALGEPTWALGAGYQYEIEDTVSDGLQANDFQYTAHQFEVSVRLPQIWRTSAQLAYVFRLESYEFPNSRVNFAFRRHDYPSQVALALQHPLNDYVALTLDYVGVFNGSNIEDFDYTRNIVAGGVLVSF